MNEQTKQTQKLFKRSAQAAKISLLRARVDQEATRYHQDSAISTLENYVQFLEWELKQAEKANERLAASLAEEVMTKKLERMSKILTGFP